MLDGMIHLWGRRTYADPYGTNTYSGASGNAIEIAQLGTGKKMAPFFHSKLAKRPLGTIRVADYDESAVTCNFDALAAVASTGNMPVKIRRTHRIF